MTILVTGANGFLGSHAVDLLLREGRSVRALVRDAGRAVALRDRGVEVLSGDVRDAAAFRAAASGTEAVLHCAAAVGPHFSKREIYDINLNGVRNALDAVRAAGRGRLVMVSSVNVMGTRNLDPATEETPRMYSRDPAADVKIDAEKLALEAAGQGVDVVIVRPGFVYGPGDPHNLPKLVRAVERGKFRFLGSRDNLIPIVHVSDAASALYCAAAVPAARGRVYNVTDGTRTTIGQFVDRIAECLGCPPPTKKLPLIVPQAACVLFDVLGVAGIKGPINRAGVRFLGTSRFVDVSRARRELGYDPKVFFKDGIEAGIRWLKQQEQGAVHASGHSP